jgi:two-component system OmpR family sensor kinase
MAVDSEQSPWRLTPFRIAAIYLLIGGAWILVSDQLVAALPLDRSTVTWLQTTKGWLFVAASGLAIYALTATGRRQLSRTNERLQQTLRHSSVLHRVLRHNLRNACNVIELQSTELAEQASNGQAPKAAIERQVTELLNLGQKSGQLRQIALAEQRRRNIALDRLIDREIEEFRERHPGASVEMDVPEGVRVSAYPELEHVFGELFENAVEHTDGDVHITVGVRQTGGRVMVDVADDGPGLPEMERQVLKEGMEKPLHHSQGLGLWIVRIIVEESGGTLAVVDNEPEGTIVRLELRAANGPVVPEAERSGHQTVYPPATME